MFLSISTWVNPDLQVSDTGATTALESNAMNPLEIFMKWRFLRCDDGMREMANVSLL